MKVFYSYLLVILLLLFLLFGLYLFRKLQLSKSYHNNLTVLYEDEYILVINKPANIASHNSSGWYGISIVDILTANGCTLYKSDDECQDGIVHRLDVGTSGIMVLAKNKIAYKSLKDQFKYRTVTKIYHALVEGNLIEQSGAIYDPIGRLTEEDYAFDVIPDGKPSRTYYKKLEFFPELNLFPATSLIEINLETGRTHQIRIHFSNINHPLVGDLRYGSDRGTASRLEMNHQWLHAKKLEFNHPLTGKRLLFNSEYPPDLKQSLYILSNNTINKKNI